MESLQTSVLFQCCLVFRTVDASFQFYGQLELVDFSNNQMAELPDRGFAKQSKLTHLTMDFNQIANLTNTTFLGLRSLTHLSLRGNRLARLESHAFSVLNEVPNFFSCLSVC